MHAKKGFTIVELTVAITIASVALIAFLPMIANFLSAQYAQMAHAKQVNDMHKAITILNTDLQRAMKFRASTSIKGLPNLWTPGCDGGVEGLVKGNTCIGVMHGSKASTLEGIQAITSQPNPS